MLLFLGAFFGFQFIVTLYLQETFASWLRERELSVDSQPDIRRLRKPSKVEKAITFKGRVSDIADDHSVRTFHRHYAHGTTWKVIAGAVGGRGRTASHWAARHARLHLQGGTPVPLPTDAPASSARSPIWRRATWLPPFVRGVGSSFFC
ncbi:hypothetical protein KEF29_29670 [Streptomyces tuirus]|uniref:Uncharacterized protein n=1 Tax=Streptomyces tuirus TaxID=68278 RepID=A0A941J7S8_9ACTN|nr:hypothetical protein [Streptomyces tuirus]